MSRSSEKFISHVLRMSRRIDFSGPRKKSTTSRSKRAPSAPGLEPLLYSVEKYRYKYLLSFFWIAPRKQNQSIVLNMRSLTNYPRGTSFQLLFLDALAISLSCQTDTESRLQYIIATIRGPSEIHISMQILRSKCSNCHLPDFDNSIRSCFLL